MGSKKSCLLEAEKALEDMAAAKTGTFSLDQAISAMAEGTPVFIKPMTKARAKKIKASIELIGPKEAERMIQKSAANRQPYIGNIRQYSTDMKNGRWTISPDAVAIDEHGNCFNAKHRLMAVIDSGIPQWFVVVRNLPTESRSVTDIGKSRSLDDLFQCLGLNADRKNKIGPLVRGIMRCHGLRNKMSPHMLVECAVRLKKAIEFVSKNLPTGASYKRISINPIRCAVGKAFYSMDQKRLERFCEVMRDGRTSSDKDRAAFEFREFLLKEEEGRYRCRSDVQALYQRACTALQAFAEGESVPMRNGKIRKCEDDPFPMPAGIFKGIPAISRLRI